MSQILQPNPDIFANKSDGAVRNVIQTGAKFHVFEKVEYPKEGGIYMYYKDLPYPKKGFPYPEAIFLNDSAKRFTIAAIQTFAQKDLILPMIAFAILPRKKKIKILSTALEQYCRMGEYILHTVYLKPERYCNLCQGLNIFIVNFLAEIGINRELAARVSKIFITTIEYDDAYRLRIEDILSTTSKTYMIEYPIFAIEEMLATFIKREQFGIVKEKAKSFGRLLMLALYIPSVRRAFRNAWQSIPQKTFTLMQLDKADRYHTLTWGSYDFQGMSIDRRMRRFVQRHTRSKCCDAPVSDTSVGTDETITCRKCGKLCKYYHTFPPMMEVMPDEENKIGG